MAKNVRNCTVLTGSLRMAPAKKAGVHVMYIDQSIPESLKILFIAGILLQ